MQAAGAVISLKPFRVYKSGLVLWRSGLKEDHLLGPEGRDLISFIGVIFSVTEWLLFAKRFFESFLSVDDSVRLTVRASGIKGRRLASLDRDVHFEWNFRAEIPEFELKETAAISDLRTDPEAIARKIIRSIFELFNWNDPDDAMIHSWQQKLIQREY